MKKLEIKKGIYAIVNNLTNSIYVGQSGNIRTRINIHKHNLIKGKYKNKSKSYVNLQNDYNEDTDNFEFIVLQEAEDNLNDLEDSYIEQYRSKNWNVYNIETNKEKKIRLKNGINKGHTKTQEMRENYKTSKHLEQHKDEIMFLHYQKKSKKYIADQFGCSGTLIARYIKRWS